jgi:hypothetical protein
VFQQIKTVGGGERKDVVALAVSSVKGGSWELEGTARRRKGNKNKTNRE